MLVDLKGEYSCFNIDFYLVLFISYLMADFFNKSLGYSEYERWCLT